MEKKIGQKNSVDSGRESLTRYYVYLGSGCNEWLDYETLEDAVQENPGEWVFDRVTKQPVPETRKD